MSRKLYVCNVANPDWRIGQYFIVDDNEENFVPAKAVRTGPRGKFTLEADSKIELPFGNSIRPYVLHVGEYLGDTGDNDGIIIT